MLKPRYIRIVDCLLLLVIVTVLASPLTDLLPTTLRAQYRAHSANFSCVSLAAAPGPLFAAIHANQSGAFRSDFIDTPVGRSAELIKFECVLLC